MSRKPIVGGNWKCNPAKLSEATALLEAWKGTSFDAGKVDVVIAPTALHISSCQSQLSGMGMMVAAQNCSKTDQGAFTGEWSAANLADMQIPYVVLGHSERRAKFGETDQDVADKVEKALAAGLKILLCIGESLDERNGGQTDEVNKRQLAPCLPKISADKWADVVIAYEPVWAIGTGVVATPDQAEETQAAVRAYIKEAVSADVADKVRIQYGGSVTPENCGELMKKPNIDGFLVGGASLKPTFMNIITTVAAG